jgi:hypothetical protein
MMTVISSCAWLFIFVCCCIKEGLLLLFARVEHITKNTTTLLLCCSLSFPFQSSARTESWESRPPEQAFASGHLLRCVRAIRFSGSVSATASRFLLHRNVFISFLVVPFLPRVGFVYFLVDVQGTTRHTSSYTDYGPRLRATHHEWV